MSEKIRRIAITGGVASGKSLVGKILQEQGYPVIDADEVVHQLLSSDTSLIEKIADAFGSQVLNEQGQIHRKTLGDLVFHDIDKRRLLEQWLHPRVRETLEDFFRTPPQDITTGFALIPLLFESSRAQPYERQFDEVWLLDVDEATQKKRLIEHRGMGELEAQNRINNQMPLHEKKHWAQQHPCAHLISNMDGIEALETAIKHLCARIGTSLITQYDVS